MIDAVLRNELAVVDANRPGTCIFCHTWVSNVQTRCENCDEVAAVIGADPIAASFVTLYTKPSALRNWLTQYKARPGDVDQYDPAAAPLLRQVLQGFVDHHWRAIRSVLEPLDAILIVPSTDRTPPHPLERIVAEVDLGIPVMASLSRTSEPIGYRTANPNAYKLADTSAGARIYLIDDVYTTGAHLNSAAEAIRLGGGHVAGALVLARRINPDYHAAARALWDDARSGPFTWADGPFVAESAS